MVNDYYTRGRNSMVWSGLWLWGQIDHTWMPTLLLSCLGDSLTSINKSYVCKWKIKMPALKDNCALKWNMYIKLGLPTTTFIALFFSFLIISPIFFGQIHLEVNYFPRDHSWLQNRIVQLAYKQFPNKQLSHINSLTFRRGCEVMVENWLALQPHYRGSNFHTFMHSCETLVKQLQCALVSSPVKGHVYVSHI